MEFKKMNINNTVKVKLNNYGLLILKDSWNDLRNDFPKLQEWEPPKTDSNGYTEFQLWSFMESFGQYMYIGNPNTPFEMDILVEVE
jgi:hypothetical protein